MEPFFYGHVAGRAQSSKTMRIETASIAPTIRLQTSNDFVEVPAAVVCALCGDPDCMGCAEERSRSGVISIVAWERPGPALARLWATAKAASRERRSLLRSAPGRTDHARASLRVLRRAVRVRAPCSAMLAGAVALLLLALGIFPDGASLAIALRVSLVAVFGLTALLVAAHATHGLSLDKGARRVSPAIRNGRARFASGCTPRGGTSCSAPSASWCSSSAKDRRRRSASPASRCACRRAARSRSCAAPTASTAERAKPALATRYVGAAIATVGVRARDHRRGHRRASFTDWSRTDREHRSRGRPSGSARRSSRRPRPAVGDRAAVIVRDGETHARVAALEQVDARARVADERDLPRTTRGRASYTSAAKRPCSDVMRRPTRFHVVRKSRRQSRERMARCSRRRPSRRVLDRAAVRDADGLALSPASTPRRRRDDQKKTPASNEIVHWRVLCRELLVFAGRDR